MIVTMSGPRLFSQQEPAPSEIPAWLDGAEMGEWFQISGTQLSSVAPPSGYIGTPAAKVSAWCGATLKRSGSLYLLGAAGGHADYSGNEVNALDLSADAPAWTELLSSSGLAQLVNDSFCYLDYRRAATHTYYATQFIDDDDCMVIMPAPGMGSDDLNDETSANQSFVDAHANEAICAYSLNGDWDHETVESTGSGTYPDYPGNGDWTACLVAKDASTGDIYYAREGDSAHRLRKLTRSTKAWSSLMGSEYWHSGYAAGSIDHTRGRLLVVGDFAGSVDPRVVRIDNGVTLDITWTGDGATALRASGYPACLYDEFNDRWLILKNGNPITCFIAKYTDTDTIDVSELSMSSAPNARQNGLLNAPQYAPELKCVVMCRAANEDVWAMRVG